jgi:LysM repeat protein
MTNAWVATSASAQAITARFGAHVIVAGLVVLAVVLSGIQLPHVQSQVESPTPTPAAGLGNRVESLTFSARGGQRLAADETQVVRQAAPLTPFIFRPRKGVITYTVEAGDTLFGIAFQHNLQPESVLWANADLKDNPDLLEVGMVLTIPPVDGVLHIVKKGDTLESIAKKYKAPSSDILEAVWNNLVSGQDLPVGQPLLVPGGTRETVVWQLPATTKAAPATAGVGGWTNAGQCLNVAPKPLGTGQFVWPTVSHLVGGNPYAAWHRGIDLAGNTGDPVFAADSGTVLWAGPNSWGYGNLVVLDHGNGWQTFYAHLSRILVRCGQQVLQGAHIGAIGSTGRSTGPHLHFETRLNGDLPNPLVYLR